jgi:hypothetical protein
MNETLIGGMELLVSFNEAIRILNGHFVRSNGRRPQMNGDIRHRQWSVHSSERRCPDFECTAPKLEHMRPCVGRRRRSSSDRRRRTMGAGRDRDEADGQLVDPPDISIIGGVAFYLPVLSSFKQVQSFRHQLA